MRRDALASVPSSSAAEPELRAMCADVISSLPVDSEGKKSATVLTL
jgi:hypothetical protein